MHGGFDPWVGKIPWRSEWQPTPVFWPGKSHGQRSLAGVHGITKSWTWLSNLAQPSPAHGLEAAVVLAALILLPPLLSPSAHSKTPESLPPIPFPIFGSLPPFGLLVWSSFFEREPLLRILIPNNKQIQIRLCWHDRACLWDCLGTISDCIASQTLMCRQITWRLCWNIDSGASVWSGVPDSAFPASSRRCWNC